MLKRPAAIARDESGLAAVEFALILPVMVTLFFGVYETSQALAARADVVNLTSSAADLVAQSSAPSATDIQNVYAAASAMLSPYNVIGDRKPAIRITSIIDDGKGIKDAKTGKVLPHASGKVDWICTQANGSALGATPSQNSTVTFGDNAIMVAGGSVIRVEVSYKYVSPTTQSITGPIFMTASFFTKPRRVPQIKQPTGNCNV